MRKQRRKEDAISIYELFSVQHKYSKKQARKEYVREHMFEIINAALSAFAIVISIIALIVSIIAL